MQNQTSKFKIGTRSSPLALRQVDEIRELFRAQNINVEFEVVSFLSAGDKNKQTSLMENNQDDFFTDTIDLALLNGDIDCAVHSAKDLPKTIHSGLEMIALTKGKNPADAFIGKSLLKDLPVGAKVGTSSLLRKNELKKYYPNIVTVDIRGTIEERIAKFENGLIDGVIIAAAALERLQLTDKITEILPWETVPLQGQLAVLSRKDDEALRRKFSSIDVRKYFGTVTLVGAGPGDPGLITLKGIKALESAECVLYDYLVHPDIIQFANKAEKIFVGKRKGVHTLSQAKLSRLIRDKAKEGKQIVRLKGGDPFIFGRGAEELNYLRSYHIQVDVIPGVSSATGIPASLGVPLTARDISSSVAFISAHQKEDEASDPIHIPDVDTCVFLMGLTKLDLICQTFLQNHWAESTPVLIVSRGTMPDQQLVLGTLMDIQDKIKQTPVQQPALIIVGRVINFYDQTHEKKSVILYTGTNPKQYAAFGDVIHFPMIQISKAEIPQEEINKIGNSVHDYDYILVTSRFGIQYFFENLDAQKIKYDKKRLSIIAIGKSTASAIRRFQIEPVLTAAVETSEGLLEAIHHQLDVEGKKILFPRSAIPNPYLKEGLTKLGAVVDEWAVYQNTIPQKRPLPEKKIDQIIFTSPSTVMNFLKHYGKIPEHWGILSKGTYTRKPLIEAGYQSQLILS